MKTRYPGHGVAALWTAATLVAAAALMPAVYLVVRASGADSEALASFQRMRTLELTGLSAGLAVLVALSALAIGLPLAWLTTRSDLPGRRVWTAVLAAPLAIPSYVGAYTAIGAFGAGGLLPPVLPVRGFVAAWWVLTLLTYPYVLLPVRAALLRSPPAVEETARSLGLSPFQALIRVVLPQVRPAAASGALLVALYVLSDFGAVALLDCDTFTAAIFSRFENADLMGGALYALVLVAVCLLLVAFEQRVRGSHSLYVRRAARRPTTQPLGRWKIPTTLACGAFASLAVGVPLAVLGVWASRGDFSSDALAATGALSWDSVKVSSLAALATAVAALPIAYVAARRPGWAATLLDRAAHVGFALPGLVIALSLVSLSVGVRWLYQSLPLLIVAYLVHFLPQSLGSTRSGLLQVDPQLGEAARSLGRTPLGAFRSVTLPLIAPAIVAGALLVFLTTMKELPTTLLLHPTGLDTLAIRMWSYIEEGFFAEAALPAVALVVFAGLPTLALLLTRRAGRKTLA